MDLKDHLQRAKCELRALRESAYKLKGWIDQYMRFSVGFKIISISPMLLYLVIFQSQATIPSHLRPDIDSTTLPSIEDAILFGGSLQHWPRDAIPDNADWFINLLDLYAGFLYLVHFVGAWFFALGLWFLYRKKTVHDKPIPQPWTFLFCLGLLNLTAVICQISWPTAPPWYNEKYGSEEPSYAMSGDEAGLENVDSMLGMSLFNGLYGTSPLVFASFPSLHGGWPIIIALTLPGKWKILGFCYAISVWWAAMYLGHHFLTDLIGSLIFSLISYYGGVFILKRIMTVFPDFSFVHNKGWHKLSKMGDLRNIKIVSEEEMSPIEVLPQE